VAACLASLCLAACGSIGSAPRPVSLDGAPNGVAARRTDGTIYLTDDTSNAILASSDGERFSAFATIPAAGERHSLSQIATGADGELFVERFGFGKSSALRPPEPPALPADQLSAALNPPR
jgi:glucose/arabinose dehydrogenase